MSNIDNLETWSVEQLKALLRAKREEDIEDIHKQLARKLKTYNELEEENKDLKESIAKTEEEAEDALASLNFFKEANEELKVELKKLRTMEKDIMEEEHAGILGCNPYERFSYALAELNYDEKWILELKQEIKELREKVKE